MWDTTYMYSFEDWEGRLGSLGVGGFSLSVFYFMDR